MTFAYLVGDEPITFSWLWSFLNEHRIPLQRVLYISSIRMAGMDFRSGMFLNMAMLGAAAAVFMVVARSLRGRSHWTDLAFPAMFLHLGQFENYLNAFQISFVVGTLLTAIIAAIILRIGSQPTWRQVVGLGFCTLLLPLDGGTTLVFVPPLLAYMVVMLVAAYRSTAADRTQTLLACSTAIALVTGLSLAYFVGFRSTQAPPFALLPAARGVVEFASTAWGSGGMSRWLEGGLAMLLLMSATGLVLLHQTWRNTEKRMQSLGLLALLAGFALLICSISYGRGLVAPMWAASSRYGGLMAPGLALCILILMQCRVRPIRWTAAAACIGAIAMLWPNTIKGEQEAARQDLQYAALKRDIANRLPVDAIASRHASFIYIFDTASVPQRILSMQQHRIGPFAELSSPLPRFSAGLLVVPLREPPTPYDMWYDQAAAAWVSTTESPYLVCKLPDLPRIAGIRLHARIDRPAELQHMEPYVSTQYFWAHTARNQFTRDDRYVLLRNPISHDISQLVWIYDHADVFRIDPDVRPCRFTVWQLDALVVPQDAATNPLYQLAQGTTSTAADPPFLVSDVNSQAQQLVFSLPTAFRLNTAGKRSLTVEAGLWRETQPRRMRLRITGPGIDTEHVFVPGAGPLQIQLPPESSTVDLEFSSRRVPRSVRAAISRFELD